MSGDPIVIVSCARTAMGSFKCAFSSLAAADLGGAPIKSAVERAGMTTLVEGQKINFEIEQDRRTGKSAAGSLSKAA